MNLIGLLPFIFIIFSYQIVFKPSNNIQELFLSYLREICQKKSSKANLSEKNVHTCH